MANIITNPSFETNTTGWDANASGFTNSGSTFTRITTDFQSGTACCDVSYTDATNQKGINDRTIDFVADTTYRFSAWVRWKSGRPVRIRVRDWNNGSSRTFSSEFTSVDAWVELSIIFTAGPSAGVHANNLVSVVTDTTVDNGQFYVDNVVLDSYPTQQSCGILVG